MASSTPRSRHIHTQNRTLFTTPTEQSWIFSTKKATSPNTDQYVFQGCPQGRGSGSPLETACAGAGHGGEGGRDGVPSDLKGGETYDDDALPASMGSGDHHLLSFFFALVLSR